MQKLIIILLLHGVTVILFSQKNIELYGGLSYTNINDVLNGQQRVRIYPVNAPNYLLNFHFGLDKNIFEKNRFGLSLGLGFYNKGSSDFGNIIFPVDTIVKHQLSYLQTPIRLRCKLLKEREISIELGVLPAYLLRQSAYDLDHDGESTPVFPTAEKFQLDYSIGLRIPIFKRLHGRIVYSQGILSVDKAEINVPAFYVKSFNHSFDLSIIYKL